MEINPKKIFSKGEINLPHVNKNKGKEEEKKSAEKKTKAPSNPSFYSNYYGIHKVSFGQTQKTDSERLEYLKQMKTSQGTPMFEASQFEPSEEGEESFLVRLSKDEKQFEFFKTLTSIKYDNGENVYTKKAINQLVETTLYLDSSGEEEFEMYGIKGKIRFDDDLQDFVQTFINEKDESGKYLFDEDNLITTLITAYLFKPKDTPSEDILKNFREIYTANKKFGENQLPLSGIIELTVAKTIDEECKNIDIEKNMEKILNYCNSELSPIIAARVLMSDADTQKTFDKLITYKNPSGGNFFLGEDSLAIAKKFKGNGKIFELIDKLTEKKDENDEPVFKSGVISYILQAGENAQKNALKLCEETDLEKQKAIANMYMSGKVIADDVLFERAQKVFDLKNNEGRLVCDYYSAGDIVNDESSYNNFIKYAPAFAQYSVNNIPQLCKLTDKQCSQIIELLNLSKKEDGTTALWAYGLEDYVQDDETFEIAKKLIALRDKDNEPIVHTYSFRNAFKSGKDSARKYLQAAELLQSTGIGITSNAISQLSEKEGLLEKAEIFRGIIKENGKPILKFDELVRFANDKNAERIAQILKLKTSDGKYLEIPFHYFPQITDGTDEEFNNSINYIPKMAELKDSAGRNVFTNVQDTIPASKLGEKAYKRASVLLGFKKTSSEALFQNYNIQKAILLDDKSWGTLLKAAAEKNSLGENLFTKDTVIMSVATDKNITDIDEFFKKAKAVSELRHPKDKQRRLISEEGILETAKQDKDFIPKFKEYAPKLLEIKNAQGRYVISEDNIHRFILNNDMSVDKLCHYITNFSNFKTERSEGTFFSDYNMIKAIRNGEEYCDEITDLLHEISSKKTNNGIYYVSSVKLNQLLGEDLEKVKKYKSNLDKLSEFNDYPYESNICNIAEMLAAQSDEEVDKAIELARYKDRNGTPFFTHYEVQRMAIKPELQRNSDIGVIHTLDKATKDNLQPLIDSVTDLKEKMMSKPELYINGTFEREEYAKESIKTFFDTYKGRLMLMFTIFDKETIDNIMRKRLAISGEILNELHGFDEKEQSLLKRLIASTNVNGKPFMAAQKIQFIHLLHAYKINRVETTEIEQMLEEGKVDIGKAELTLLRNILKKADFTEEEIAQIPPEKIYAWNSEYLHLLITDMKDIPALKDLFTASLKGDFNEYINSEDNEYGKVNNNTKNIYKEAGLNYDAWVKPNDDLKINYISRDKNEETLIQISKQIEEDIEALRSTPAKKFIDKQLGKYIKDDKFTVPANLQTNKTLLKGFVINTISKLDSVWERAKKNVENPDLRDKASNTLTILDHLNQRIKDIEETPEVNASKNLDLTIKMWERRPEKDIFQGNYSTCCIAIGNFNSSAMPHFVLDTAYNMIEITDNFTGKTLGNALCYMIKDKDGTPSFVIDNIEISNSNKLSEAIGVEIRNKMAEYAAKVAKEVTGKDDTPIYMSDNFNDVSTADLKSEYQDIEFLGDISADKIYMDLYGGWIPKDRLKSAHKLLRLR